jgi:hypothetical protein
MRRGGSYVGESGANGDLSGRVGEPAVVQRVFEQMPQIVSAVIGPELRFVAVNGAGRAFMVGTTFSGCRC